MDPGTRLLLLLHRANGWRASSQWHSWLKLRSRESLSSYKSTLQGTEERVKMARLSVDHGFYLKPHEGLLELDLPA